MKGHKTVFFSLCLICFFGGCGREQQKSEVVLDEINSFSTIHCPFCDGSDKDCPNCHGNKKDLKTEVELQ
jgi:hypothetical protein